MASTPYTGGADQLSVENAVGSSRIYLKNKEYALVYIFAHICLPLGSHTEHEHAWF